MRITVKNGVGREVNPYVRDEFTQLLSMYEIFESKVLLLPVFAEDGITILPDGEYGAELIQQCRENWFGNFCFCGIGKNCTNEKRQVYIAEATAQTPIEKGCPFDEPLPAADSAVKPVFINRDKILEIINRTLEVYPKLAEMLSIQVMEL